MCCIEFQPFHMVLQKSQALPNCNAFQTDSNRCSESLLKIAIQKMYLPAKLCFTSLCACTCTGAH